MAIATNTINDTTITFRTNRETKERAQSLFDELGMDLSTAMNVFLKKSVRENRIPFEIAVDEPNEETYRAIENAINDKDMVGPFYSVEEAMEYLNADD